MRASSAVSSSARTVSAPSPADGATEPAPPSWFSSSRRLVTPGDASMVAAGSSTLEPFVCSVELEPFGSDAEITWGSGVYGGAGSVDFGLISQTVFID